MADNLYDILGVKKDASDKDVRAAYRKLARKYHPDLNPGDEDAEKKFKQVAAAYDVLSDEERRKAYDEFGEASLEGGFDPEQARAYQQWQRSRQQGAHAYSGQQGPQGVDFDLSDLFGFGFRGGGPRGPMQGQDLYASVTMELGQAIQGGEVQLDMPGRKPIKVRIPKGADNGSTIRLQGKGRPGVQGGPPGDLIIETQVMPHPLVTRNGLNLYMKVPVTLDEAYNGATIDVPTFSGTVKLKIPPLSQTETKLRLRGKGVERGSKTGDLFVELDLRLPDTEDKELAEALNGTAKLYSTPVRKDLSL